MAIGIESSRSSPYVDWQSAATYRRQQVMDADRFEYRRQQMYDQLTAGKLYPWDDLPSLLKGNEAGFSLVVIQPGKRGQLERHAIAKATKSTDNITITMKPFTTVDTYALLVSELERSSRIKIYEMKSTEFLQHEFDEATEKKITIGPLAYQPIVIEPHQRAVLYWKSPTPIWYGQPNFKLLMTQKGIGLPDAPGLFEENKLDSEAKISFVF